MNNVYLVIYIPLCQHVFKFPVTFTRQHWSSNVCLEVTGKIITLCLKKKTAPLRQVGINSVIFRIQKNPKYMFFVGNFIQNKNCEFYYDGVTMTSFIGNK